MKLRTAREIMLSGEFIYECGANSVMNECIGVIFRWVVRDSDDYPMIIHYIRSYHVESTMIHSNHEVKLHRACLVLSWGTRWEAQVTNVFNSATNAVLIQIVSRTCMYWCREGLIHQNEVLNCVTQGK